MNYQILFHPSVKQEYLEAFEWYESQKTGLGDRFLTAVDNKLKQIATNPEFFSRKTKKGFRDAVVGVFPYIIYYKIIKQEKIVEVMSIVHQKKHPSSRTKK